VSLKTSFDELADSNYLASDDFTEININNMEINTDLTRKDYANIGSISG
jgi:hypothetical protein